LIFHGREGDKTEREEPPAASRVQGDAAERFQADARIAMLPLHFGFIPVPRDEGVSPETRDSGKTVWTTLDGSIDPFAAIAMAIQSGINHIAMVPLNRYGRIREQYTREGRARSGLKAGSEEEWQAAMYQKVSIEIPAGVDLWREKLQVGDRVWTRDAGGSQWQEGVVKFKSEKTDTTERISLTLKENPEEPFDVDIANVYPGESSQKREKIFCGT
jgi:hypothetical protein